MQYYSRSSVKFVPNRQTIPSSLLTCSLTMAHCCPWSQVMSMLQSQARQSSVYGYPKKNTK